MGGLEGAFMDLLKSRAPASNEEGQAVTEYILMLFVIVGFYWTVIQGLASTQLGPKLIQAMSADYAHAYQYGHPQALGYDDPGGPFMHPRAVTGSASQKNFRIFLVDNPQDNNQGGQ